MAHLERRQAAVRQRSKNIRRSLRTLETCLAGVRRRQRMIRSWRELPGFGYGQGTR